MLTPEQHEQAARNDYNFDHPDAFDYNLLTKTLKRLKAGKQVDVPVYNFTTHSREKRSVRRNLDRIQINPISESLAVHLMNCLVDSRTDCYFA